MDLVTHGVNDIVNRSFIFIVNQVLSPNFGIDFLSSFQMLADRVLSLGDLSKEFVLVNVKTGLSLS